MMASGAMNESVMANTLSLSIECSPWIVHTSIMSMPTCSAQTDGHANFCYTHQSLIVGLFYGVHVLYCPIVPWTGRLETFIFFPYMYINMDVGERTRILLAITHTAQYAYSACKSLVAWLHMSTYVSNHACIG